MVSVAPPGLNVWGADFPPLKQWAIIVHPFRMTPFLQDGLI